MNPKIPQKTTQQALCKKLFEHLDHLEMIVAFYKSQYKLATTMMTPLLLELHQTPEEQ